MTRFALALAVTAAGIVGAVTDHPHKRPRVATASVSEPRPLPRTALQRASRGERRSPLPRATRHRGTVRVHGGGDLDWRALAYCEATGNPRAVSPDGRYRGAYQFDAGTWRSVGGTGDPAAAPLSEQTYRAQLLYAQRGRAPWPVCGRFL